MATINLRPVADTVLVGQDVRTINGAAAALIGNLLDGLGGADVIIADDFYPASSHFTLSADTTGILTMTTASGTIKFKNFETIQFQNLSVKLGTAANDIITGTSKADAFLFGAAGNDTINGGAGADKMYGGLGNDIFTIETVGDTAIEAAAQGIDLVKSSITHTLG
ncbi:MAG: hypothetical protein ABL907_07245, partial [Hyphomicrobium sp.]